MFVELHLLQNFAPSNLNRDDTNSPKDCEFGGIMRARISSQCLKRAVRTAFKDEHLIDDERLAIRTKRLVDELTERMSAQGRDLDQARAVAELIIEDLGLKLQTKGERLTQYLLFLGEAEIAQVTAICLEQWDTYAARTGAGKKDAKAKKSPETKALTDALDGGKAVDLALFGRMLADRPELNVDAASQVAHALSTNKVSTEFDFFTAVDDIKPQDTAGADMLGTVEFNSACFYRYSNLDLTQLARNLQGDEELARTALEAFLRASISAVPTGKQNSMAAHNPPSLVYIMVRENGLQNLANAFVRPVRAGADDLVTNSVAALDAYCGRLATMYGTESVRGAWLCTLDGQKLQHLKEFETPSVADAISGAIATAHPGT